jgi:hypothetical protein
MMLNKASHVCNAGSGRNNLNPAWLIALYYQYIVSRTTNSNSSNFLLCPCCAFEPPNSSSSDARKLNADRLNQLDSCTPFPSSHLESSSRAILPPGGTLLPVYTNWPSLPGITALWYVSDHGSWPPLRLRLINSLAAYVVEG